MREGERGKKGEREGEREGRKEGRSKGWKRTTTPEHDVAKIQPKNYR